MDWSIVVGWFMVGVGGALAAGVGLALLRYWRTGRFPDQPEDVEPSLLSAWVKVGLGVILLVWGLATLDRAGVL